MLQQNGALLVTNEVHFQIKKIQIKKINPYRWGLRRGAYCFFNENFVSIIESCNFFNWVIVDMQELI